MDIATERKRPIELLAHAGQIIARLHARGKTNEQIKRETLPLVEEDAQLAIACLGLVLRNVSWI